MAQGHKTGGRQKGTPNKASTAVQTFLRGVFDDAIKDPQFRVELLVQLVTLKMDNKLLSTLMAYAYGTPARQVEHVHSGKLTLEQIVSGVGLEDDDDDEDGE